MSEYTQGVCQDGAAILRDGQPMTIEQILHALREYDAALEREQALAAYVEILKETGERAAKQAHGITDEYRKWENACESFPETSLIKRDLIKQSDELERTYRIASRKYNDGKVPFRDLLDRALELRKQAEAQDD